MKVVELPVTEPVVIDSVELRNGIEASSIDGATEIRNGSIFADKLVVGSQGWVHDIVFTATDYNTASWATGTLTTADGTEYTIDAGNTGNITAKTYVYFDGTSVLKTTTTQTDAMTDTNIILAIVEASSDTDAYAIMLVFGQTGTTIDGDQIVTGRISSTDGKTYFDLDDGQLVVNDGTTNRVHVGKDVGGY